MCVWRCSTLTQPPGGTLQSQGVSQGRPSKSPANNSLFLFVVVIVFFFFSLFPYFSFWNDACELKLRPQSLISVARFQFYVQRFQIPEGHLQRQVQPPRDHHPPFLLKTLRVPLEEMKEYRFWVNVPRGEGGARSGAGSK